MSRAYWNDEPEVKKPKGKPLTSDELLDRLFNATLEWNRARREKLRQRGLRNRSNQRCLKRADVYDQPCFRILGESEIEKWCRFCLQARVHQGLFRAALNQQRSWHSAVMRYADKIDGLKPERRYPTKAKRRDVFVEAGALTGQEDAPEMPI